MFRLSVTSLQVAIAILGSVKLSLVGVSAHISKLACPNFIKFSISTHTFSLSLSLAVARPSSDDSAVSYVLPVL